MNPRVSKVYPTDDYKLKLVFKNGERGFYHSVSLHRKQQTLLL